MNANLRDLRLQADLAAMEALRAQSTILEFTTSGTPPDQYKLVFLGKGATREAGALGSAAIVDRHEIELRLPYSYPERPPEVRWTSPITHPNVSFSGYVSASELGMPAGACPALDVVVERLWDLARLQYVDLEHASNFPARTWLESQRELPRPIDPRPLRDRAAGQPTTNVIRYARPGQSRPAQPRPTTASSEEVLFIGPDTPAPPLPPAPPSRRKPPGDDVLYIGDE